MVKAYKVVSWLMFAKEEFVRALILLLLRSLRRKRTQLIVSFRISHTSEMLFSLFYWSRKTTDRRGGGGIVKHLHQLQIFEGGKLFWHDAKLVAVQVPAERGSHG